MKAINTGLKLIKTDEIDTNQLQLQLIEAQYALRETRQIGQPRGVLILVNGMETSGKGGAVTQLREWVDPRLLKVHTSLAKQPCPTEPIWQRHTKQLPRHGEVAVMFGNWYADLIYAVIHEKLDQQKLSAYLKQITDFENDLIANDTLVVKCWFEVDKKTLKKRLKDNKDDPEWLYHIDWHDENQVNTLKNWHNAIKTDWHCFNGKHLKAINIAFASVVLDAMRAKAHQRPKAKRPYPSAAIPKLLLTPSTNTLNKNSYKHQLEQQQQHFAKRLRNRGNRHVVLVFEGMDAAGKGGAIKRLVAPLDPREYQIYNIAAPEPIELQHPYLWRFWTRLPSQTNRGSQVKIFDRSWYGRVLVERIEALAKQAAWQQAYAEINRFEADLTASGTLVIKFWLAISIDEQLSRFEARENTPHKRYKITADDWRNRERWEDYVQAASDMLAKTNTANAPWHIIATNDKATARLHVLQTCIAVMEKAGF